MNLKLRIDPDQASVLAILAQEERVGARLNNYQDLAGELKGDALQIARVLFREIPQNQAKPEVQKAATDLRNWVRTLRSKELCSVK